MWIERSRPGREAEEKARELVRASYPRAVSMYVDDGAPPESDSAVPPLAIGPLKLRG